MQTVLPLSYAEIEDICVMKSPWDGVLLLLTLEHGALRLRLFDEASCTVLEDYTLDSYSSMPQVVQGENVLLLLSYDVPERSFLALVREDGQYVPSLRGTLPNKSYRWYDPAVAYRNGHLAFATLSPTKSARGFPWKCGYGRKAGRFSMENSCALLHGRTAFIPALPCAFSGRRMRDEKAAHSLCCPGADCRGGAE